MPYKDLREYLESLKCRGLLQIVDDEVNKDTELVPLVRLQFRGLPEARRRAFWFRRVTDALGRRFDGSVTVGSWRASRAVYGAALELEPENIAQRWAAVPGNHLKPVVVGRERASVKEVVRRVPNLGEGVDLFPHLISTRGSSRAVSDGRGMGDTRSGERGVQLGDVSGYGEGAGPYRLLHGRGHATYSYSLERRGNWGARWRQQCSSAARRRCNWRR